MAGTGAFWLLSLGAYAFWRLWLNRAYGEAFVSPGAALFGALIMCLAWLMAEPPRIAQGWRLRLGALLLGLILLYSGETLLWLRSGDKALYESSGFALLLTGALLLLWQLRKSAAPQDGQAWPLGRELAVLMGLLILGAGLRLYRLGEVPSTWWYDEVNLARAVQDHILEGGELPIYLTENVENPGMYLWICGIVFKLFGVGITQLRYLSAFFGWLSLLPFYFLARRLLGAAWGLAALALFCAMRWTLIPQHIAFMSGFAIFWTLSAVYFYWRALGSKKALDFALAGLALGFTLHTYTPTRLVLPMLGLFSLLHLRLLKGVKPAAWLALLGGFLLVAGPMLLYILDHWGAYSLRASQVSIMNDVRAKGWGELWISFTKHLASFNYLGDFNARHNIHFWPHLDFVTGALFAPALLWAHARFYRDPRATLFTLWFWIMLSAGIFSMTVEAPQGHRTILVAPMAALAVAWLLSSGAEALKAAWPAAEAPLPLAAALFATLLAVPLHNGYELYANWPDDSATWRSFSPESTLAARRALQSGPGWEVYLSQLKNEYQFHGFERDQFMRFALKQQGRGFYQLKESQELVPGKGAEPMGVLAIWGESDDTITALVKRDFPDIAIEDSKDPFEPKSDYLAAQIPWERIPRRGKPGLPKDPFFFRP